MRCPDVFDGVVMGDNGNGGIFPLVVSQHFLDHFNPPSEGKGVFINFLLLYQLDYFDSLVLEVLNFLFFNMFQIHLFLLGTEIV